MILYETGSLDNLGSPLSGNISDTNATAKIEVCTWLDEQEGLMKIKEPERPTKIMNQHIEKAGLDDLQVVKALGAGGFGLVKLVKVKGT